MKNKWVLKMVRRKKKKKFHLDKRWYFFMTTLVITLGLVLLITNRTKPKELEYSIEFHETEAEIYIGESHKFGYTIINPKGNDKLKWTTSNNQVATIDIYGNVKGISFGDITITVELENGSKSQMKIRVRSYPVYLRLKTDINPIKGWFNQKVNVTLETLNIDDIKYCISDEEECLENINYKDKITLSNGIKYLNIKGLDKNGKVVEYREMFKIDMIAPKCNVTRIGKLYEETATAEVICEEDASGIDKYEWYRDNERIEMTVDRTFNLSKMYLSGKHKYSVKVYDLVGNSSTYQID